jgi:hypothetical protein
MGMLRCSLTADRLSVSDLSAKMHKISTFLLVSTHSGSMLLVKKRCAAPLRLGGSPEKEKREIDMEKFRFVAVVALGAAVSASTALAGPDWVEKGDAGSTIGDAQKTFGVGPLRTISGGLSMGVGVDDFEDMYLIRVEDPLKFSMTLKGADFDAQLFIFNVTLANEAFGLLANQGTEDSNIPVLGPFSTDGSGAALTQPGVYAIAISGMGRNPVSHTGEIFFFADPYEISGPDGPGGLNPHIDWVGVGEVGSYIIEMDGVGFYAPPQPAPGTLALLALTALLGNRRRR